MNNGSEYINKVKKLKNIYIGTAIILLQCMEWGRIGKNPFNVISGTQMEVHYVIDQYLSIANGYYRSVPCYNSKSFLPKTDLIIVTVSGEADSILSQLAGCGSPGISIQRLIEQAAGWECKAE